MRIILLLLLNFSICIASGQGKPQDLDPPGTIQIDENLYIDKIPVSNQMFLEYLKMKDYLDSHGYQSWKSYYTEKNDTLSKTVPLGLYPSFLKALEGEGSFLSKRGYFWDYRYAQTPVLRVSKSQAEDFCKWRTEMVEYAWNFFPKYARQKEFAEKIRYRLPSGEELEEAKNYFFEKGNLVSIKEKNPLRYRSPKATDAFVLYNISEFTSTNSLYGENWEKVVPANFPNDYTGFRCVCEVKE